VGGPSRAIPPACRGLPTRRAELADRAAGFVSRCWLVAFLRSPACRSGRDPRPDRPVSPWEAGASCGVRSRWRPSEEVCLGFGQTCHIQRPCWSVDCSGGSSPCPLMRVGAPTRRSLRLAHRTLRVPSPRSARRRSGLRSLAIRPALGAVPEHCAAGWLARRVVRSDEVGLVPPSPSGARRRPLVWGLAFGSRGSVLPGGASSPRPAGSSVGSSSSNPLHRGAAGSPTAGFFPADAGIRPSSRFALATSRQREVGTGLGVVSPDAVSAARR
jgi:hypothetical protein